MRVARTLVALLAVAGSALAADNPVRTWREAHERVLIAEFTSLLAIPNLASDRANIRRNAAAIVGMMERRGLSPVLLELSAHVMWIVPAWKAIPE